MTLQETLQALRDAGVARATLTPAGELVEVEFLREEPADARSAARDPYGVPPAYQAALDVLGGGPLPEARQ